MIGARLARAQPPQPPVTDCAYPRDLPSVGLGTGWQTSPKWRESEGVRKSLESHSLMSTWRAFVPGPTFACYNPQALINFRFYQWAIPVFLTRRFLSARPI